jgi:hypothetical protein
MDREVELIHLGGERRVVPVISTTNTRITILWGMCGGYDLILSKNQFVLKSMMMWKAADIIKVLDVWQAMRFPGETNEFDRSVIAHMRSMPYQKG